MQENNMATSMKPIFSLQIDSNKKSTIVAKHVEFLWSYVLSICAGGL